MIDNVPSDARLPRPLNPELGGALEFEEALSRAKAGRLTVSDIADLCVGFDGSLPDALDTFALQTAREFMIGAIDFDAADTLVNLLFAHCSQLISRRADIEQHPELMFSIYRAFDAGEFVPKSDPPGTDPIRKYTRPQLESVLASLSSAS